MQLQHMKRVDVVIEVAWLLLSDANLYTYVEKGRQWSFYFQNQCYFRTVIGSCDIYIYIFVSQYICKHILIRNIFHWGFPGWVCSTTNLNQPPPIKLETTDVGQNILPQLIGQNLPFIDSAGPNRWGPRCSNSMDNYSSRCRRSPLWCQSRMDLCFSFLGRNGPW